MNRGYVVTGSEEWDIEAIDGFPAAILTYEVMEKPLRMIENPDSC